MARSFDRCGTYITRKKGAVVRKERKKSRKQRAAQTGDDSDEDFVDVESPYDQFDPSKGMEVLVKGYRNWAERYLSNCAGQKKHKHHTKRMGKWDTVLQTHLDEASCK